MNAGALKMHIVFFFFFLAQLCILLKIDKKYYFQGERRYFHELKYSFASLFHEWKHSSCFLSFDEHVRSHCVSQTKGKEILPELYNTRECETAGQPQSSQIYMHLRTPVTGTFCRACIIIVISGRVFLTPFFSSRTT